MSFFAHSIKAQLVALLFGLTAISIVVVSYLGVDSLLRSGGQAQDITSAAMKQQVKQFLVQTTSAAAEKNSLVFQHVQLESNDLTAFATSILNNPSLYAGGSWRFDDHVARKANGTYANPASEPGSVYIPTVLALTPQIKQEIERTVYLDQLFPTALTNESNAVATYFIGAQGDTRYYPNIGLADVVPDNYTPVGDVFFTPATPQNDPAKTVKWSVVYDDPAGNGLMITASNPVYTKANGFAGMVGMDITLNTIAKNIENYTPIESSYAFLIDNSGRAIALPDQAYHDILGRSPKQGEFGADLSKAKGDLGNVIKKMRAGASGYGAAMAGGSALDVAYAPVKGTTLSLAIVAKQSVLLKVVASLQSQVRNATSGMIYGRVLPIGAVLLLLVWAYGFLYIKRFTDPLKKLTARTLELAAGNFDIDPEPVRTKNEIGTLTSSFNTMVSDLRVSRGIIEDQNQALQREQSRLTASIKSMPFGFAVIDAGNQILFHNAILSKLFNHAIPEDPAASPAVLARIAKDFSGAIDILACIRQSQEQNQAIEHNIELGPRFFRFFFMPIIDEANHSKTAIGTVLIMEDTTEARAAERSKDEFFSIASHELRTPLTAIRGNADMIVQYHPELVKDPEVKEMMDDIHDSSVRLVAIVNDFLDMSRLEQNRLTFKTAEFDAHDLLQKVLREFDVSGSRRKLSFDLKAPKGSLPPALADVDRVRQIIVNLLGNAIKFTDHGGITVTLATTAGKLKISVSDTGKGIPVESQHLLFRKFQQASNNILTRDNTRSTGLGLYISKLLAEGMGGKLYLEKTEVDKGSTFVLELTVESPGAKTNDSVKKGSPQETDK